MRLSDIGEQLRAFRLESGLRAEEIAARLGVSRAALYRYEKGEVIKLDTVKRLAELLKISPLALLGVGVEYYSRAIGFFERLRQLEETADQILQVDGAFCFLTTGDAFDSALVEALAEASEAAGAERAQLRGTIEQLLGLQAARKRSFGQRRPTVICLVAASRVASLLTMGVAAGLAQSERVRRQCRQAAAAEVSRMAEVMESEPMGLQLGVLAGTEPTAAFMLLRGRERASVAINPFRPDGTPFASTGVATVTMAEEAVAAHQRVAESLWRDALKGPAAAAKLRQLLADYAAS
jgi:transcriptional regulator with XRE-family HTH domain